MIRFLCHRTTFVHRQTSDRPHVFSKMETEASASSSASLRLPVSLAAEIVSYICRRSISRDLYRHIWVKLKEKNEIKN